MYVCVYEVIYVCIAYIGGNVGIYLYKQTCSNMYVCRQTFINLYIYIYAYNYIYVTGVEIGFQNLWDGSCVTVKDDRSGMLMDAQACQHDSTVHAQGFFPPEGESRWLWHHYIMSLSLCLCKGRGIYIREHAWTQGLSSGFLVAVHLVSFD